MLKHSFFWLLIILTDRRSIKEIVTYPSLILSINKQTNRRVQANSSYTYEKRSERNMHKLLQMLRLQQELNDETNGIGWEKGVTKHGKRIDWKRCIYLEGAELIDSYPWKHWKNIDATPDYENIKIETVDIWHFVLSLALQIYKNDRLGTMEDLATALTQTPHYKTFVENDGFEHDDIYTEINVVETMLEDLFCTAPIETIVDDFYAVAVVADLNLDTLYKLYVGKNVLNRFRQNHGYKEGTYLKLWDGEEDNVVMQRLLDNDPDMTPDTLYQALKNRYNTIVNN